MAMLVWKDENFKERSVDLEKVKSIQTVDEVYIWEIGCGKEVFEPGLSRRLYIKKAEECGKELFIEDFETGELKNTGVRVSDVSCIDYDPKCDSMIFYLKNGSTYAVNAESYAVRFI